MTNMKSRLKTLVLRCADFFYPSFLVHVRQNKVVASSFRGRGFSGNSALVVEALLAKSDALDIVWLALDKSTPVPKGVRVVKYNSLASYFELASAKIWIDDFRKRYFPRKKREQVYYQVWHGVLPLKKIEKDAASKLDREYLADAQRDGQITDYMIAGSQFASDVYHNAFWLKGQVLKYGTPSADALFKPQTDDERKSMFHTLGVDEKLRTLLYCPTFRDDFVLSDYTLESEKLLTALTNQWGGSWRILIRLHPNARSYESEVIAANPGAIGVTQYPSVEDLIRYSDVIVTDFSSVMFEALYANKPTFILAKDYSSYVSSERGVYDIIHHLPFAVSETNDELLENLMKFNESEYEKLRTNFLSYIGSVEDGHAAERIAKKILSESIGE